jgi:hypothetical protein
MQSNPISSETDDFPANAEALTINPVLASPAKSRAVVHFSTQRWISLVKHGNTRQLSRLHKWVSKQDQAVHVFDMINLATVHSTFDSMSSPVTHKKNEGEKSVPIFMPTIACVLLWAIWTFEYSVRTETKLKANEVNLVHVMGRLSTYLNRVKIRKGNRLTK